MTARSNPTRMVSPKIAVLLALSAVVLGVLAAPRQAAAADLCVGLHPLCSSAHNYSGDSAGLQSALLASQNTFLGADTIWIAAGTYTPVSPVGFGGFGPEDDLHVKGQGTGATVIETALSNQTGIGFSNDDGHDVTVSGLSVVNEGQSFSAGVAGTNVDFSNIDVVTSHASSTVWGVRLVGDSALEDSKVTVTGLHAIAAWMEDNAKIRDSEIFSSDGNSHGVRSGGIGARTIERSKIRNVRGGVAWDNGSASLNDVLIVLSSYSGALGVSAANPNSCDGCSIGLVAKNLSMIGAGPNQIGVHVGATADTAIVETVNGSLTDSLIDMSGTGALALHCQKTGVNTVANLSTTFIATESGRIERDSGCTGQDDDLLDTTSDPPQYLFPAIGDYRPVTSSPVVDAGNPLTSALPTDTDIDGLSRVVDGDGDSTARIDIGADEYQSAMAPSEVQINASPNPAVSNQLIDFDALSLEPDGGTISYHWDFGDGNTDTGNDLQHQYSTPGIYDVTVTATDDELQHTSTTIQLHVESAPPSMPSIDADLTEATRFQNIDFTASDSVDPDGDGFSYEWRFSEGGTASGPSVTRAATSMNSLGNTTFTAYVKAVDDNGTESAEASVDVVILNKLPVATGILKSKPTAYRGETVTFTAQSSDQENDTQYFTWDMGDGSAPVVGAVNPVIERSYATLGTKTVSLSVRDPYDDPGQTNDTVSSTSTTLQVVNRDPAVGVLQHSGSLRAGDTQSFSVAASDGDGDPIDVNWSFGDGTSINTGASGGAEHTFAAPGNYTVTASVSDDQGSTVVATRTVTIVGRQAVITLGKPNKAFWLRSKGFTLGGKAPYAFIPIKTSEPVSLSISLTHVKGGYKKGKSCVKKKAGRKRCNLKLVGTAKIDLLDTSSKLMFGGKWRGRNLKPGKYIVSFKPADGGPAKSITIKLVKKKKK